MSKKRLVKGYALVILSAIIFGLMPLTAKLIYAMGINSVTLVFLRNTICLPVLAVIAKCTGGSLRPELNTLPRISIVAIMGCCITPLLLFTSYKYIPSGTATVFHFIYPAAVVAGEFIFMKSRLKRGHIISILMCVAGIILFYNPSEGINLKGSIYALMSGVTYAIYVLLLSTFGNRKMSVFAFSFYVSAICAFVMLFVCIITRQLALPTTVGGWIMTAFFSLAVNIGAVVLFQKGTFLTGGSRAAVLSTFEPVTGILVGAVVFNEAVSVFSVAGSLLVIGACIVVAYSDIRDSVHKE